MRRFCRCAGSLLVFLTLSSCDLLVDADRKSSANVPGHGLLKISLQTSSIPSSVKKIGAVLSREGFVDIGDTTEVDHVLSDSLVMVLSEVPTGIWTLTVLGMDSAGTALYEGTVEVTVLPGELIYAVLSMNQTGVGTGSIGIILTWNTHHVSWKFPFHNPVLQPSATGWDAGHTWMQECIVIPRGTELSMWYHTGVGNTQEIAYATSMDGSLWEKHGVVLPADPSVSWMELGASSPAVLLEDGVFKMWFNGKAIVMRDGIPVYNPFNGIGYATSSDRISWSVGAQQVIPVNQSVTGVFGAGITRTSSEYLLYYSVEKTLSGAKSYEIHLATSLDEETWSLQGQVLGPGPVGSWEHVGVATPQVIVSGDSYIMYYTGYSENGIMAIGKAVSSDGRNWLRASSKPMLSAQDIVGWDVDMVAYPTMIAENGKVRLWFSAYKNNVWAIGYAER